MGLNFESKISKTTFFVRVLLLLTIIFGSLMKEDNGAFVSMIAVPIALRAIIQ